MESMEEFMVQLKQASIDSDRMESAARRSSPQLAVGHLERRIPQGRKKATSLRQCGRSWLGASGIPTGGQHLRVGQKGNQTQKKMQNFEVRQRQDFGFDSGEKDNLAL